VKRKRAVLLIFLALILGTYLGWYVGQQSAHRLTGKLMITGETQDFSLSGSSPQKTPSPTSVATRCNVTKFDIVTASENFERADFRIEDLSGDQLKCLLQESQIELDGTRPWYPMARPNYDKPTYRPLSLEFESGKD
jgi:hypothetical protein